MVDEAHRSHASALHANLLRALPNCARIGFTGTPIIMGAKKTHPRDLRRVHRPLHDQGVRGRRRDRADPLRGPDHRGCGRRRPGARPALRGHVPGAHAGGAGDDQEEVRHQGPRHGGPGADRGQGAGHAAPLRGEHPAQRLQGPGGGRQPRAAIRYYEALRAGADELVAEARRRRATTCSTSTTRSWRGSSEEAQFLVRAHRSSSTRSASWSSPRSSRATTTTHPSWASGPTAAKQDVRIARFKKPLFHEDPDKRDPLAFLIVKSMLLTGFDAPIEGVMYLDRPIREHELLQAIARVNRTYAKKKCGHRRGLLRRRPPPQGGPGGLQRRGRRGGAARASRTRSRSCGTGTSGCWISSTSVGSRDIQDVEKPASSCSRTNGCGPSSRSS